jgi:D-serine deaminase-like pyridoxal phosphate-dependent protein
VIDRAALRRNVAAMAAFAGERGIALRPHAKTHKSAAIGKRQIAAGAAGLCCAKLGEAEALAGEGIDSLHLTSPVVRPDAIVRLAALNARIGGLSMVADHPDMIAALDAAMTRPLSVFVDIDPGNFRTGVASPEAAVALAQAIAASTNLRFGGVQFYCGSQQNIASWNERREAIAVRSRILERVLAALAEAGIAVPVVTGGGTGSFAIDAELGLLTELQVGSYIFLDREYRDCELEGGGAPRFEPALSVDATVISTNAEGLVTVDAGLKALSPDAGAPTLPGIAGASYRFMGDEHGAIVSDGVLPRLGERVTIFPGHCDPTVNLYDRYHVVEDGVVVEVWPVTARGCST